MDLVKLAIPTSPLVSDPLTEAAVRTSRWVAMTVVGVALGCSGPEDGDRDASSESDGDAVDGASPADSGADAGSVRVRITRPTSPHYVSSGSVDIQVFVEGGDPERVDLALDGSPIATLPPPYRYDLGADDLDEGSHEVVAVARVDGVEHSSEALELILDRTAPRVVDQRPAADEPYEAGSVLEIVFSEPMSLASIDDASAPVVNGLGEQFVVDRDLSADGRTLTITLRDGPPSAAGRILAQLGAAVRDVAGVALAATDVVWTMPLWIDDDAPLVTLASTAEWTSIGPPTAVRAVSGDIFVAAQTGAGYLAVFRRGAAGWEHLDRIGACNNLYNDGAFAFALDHEGAPLLATTVQAGTEYPIHLCRWTGASWTAAVPERIDGVTRRPEWMAVAPGPAGEFAVINQSSASFAGPPLHRYRAGWEHWSALGLRNVALTFEGGDYVASNRSSNRCLFSRIADDLTATSDSATTLTLTTDYTIETFATTPVVTRCGCAIARRAPGGWTAVPVPAGASDQRCAATITPSGRALVVSRMRSSPFELAMFLEASAGDALLDLGSEELGIELGVGDNTVQLFDIVLDALGRPLVVYLGRPTGSPEGIYAFRFNSLWAAP